MGLQPSYHFNTKKQQQAEEKTCKNRKSAPAGAPFLSIAKIYAVMDWTALNELLPALLDAQMAMTL